MTDFTALTTTTSNNQALAWLWRPSAGADRAAGLVP